MKAKHLLTCLCTAILLVFTTACVDKDFQLDNLSTEITVGGESTTLPLGYLEKKSLGEIIDEEDLDGLKIDPATGAYALVYFGEGEEISIEGIDSRFEVPETMSSFTTECPSFDLIGEGCDIQDVFYVNNLKLDNQDIPTLTIPVVAGLPIHGLEDGVLTHSLHYEIPEQVKNIEYVSLQHDASLPGAPIDVRLQFRDLAAVNGGGTITVELKAPAGYELYGMDKQLLADNTFRVNSTIAAGEDEVEYLVYLAGIENTTPIQNGVLDIPVELDYHISFNLITRDGSLTLINVPELHVDSSLKYADADVVLNEVLLLDHTTPTETVMQIDGLPAEVKSIRKVTFSDHSPVCLKAEGLDWMTPETEHLVVIEAHLPDYLMLHEFQDAVTDSAYNPAKHMLHTHLDNLHGGININLDALYFGEEGVMPQNGILEIAFAPDLVVYIQEDTKIKLSTLLELSKQGGGKLSLSAGIAASTIELQSVCGQIDYQFEEHSTIEIGGLDEDLDITINDPGLSPVIHINFNNPLTLEALVSATLTPKSKGELLPENSVTIENIAIPAAQVVNGVVESRRAALVLGEEKHRSEYPAEEYIFIPCDLGKLFVGSLPDEVTFSLVLHTDAEGFNTLYAEESYKATYSYDVNVPLSFDAGMDLAYEEVVDGLNETFADLADYDIKAGDIALLAEVHNTIPLEFTLEAEFLDAQGNPTEAQLVIPQGQNKLAGSKDGESEAVSTLRLGLDLGASGQVSQLSRVEAIRLKLSAGTATESEAALNTEQYIYLNLKLEIQGGITVDLETL